MLFGVDFDFKNDDARRTKALKLRLDLLDTFGDLIETWPITENTSLGFGDIDRAHFARRAGTLGSSVSKVNLYVVAIAYDDGTVWENPMAVPSPGPTPPDDETGVRKMPI